jgi:glycosyltransferase involved in cell wall biosynthesis
MKGFEVGKMGKGLALVTGGPGFIGSYLVGKLVLEGWRIRQGVNGLLVEPSNPKALAEAMARLAEDEELAEEMGKNGRREVFSWKEIAKKSVQLYKQILRSG